MSSTTRISAWRTLERFEQVRRGALLETVLDGCRRQNEREAARWLAARPREGDWLGESTLADQRVRWRRMTAIAEAFRRRAELAPLDLPIDVDNVLGEAA